MPRALKTSERLGARRRPRRARVIAGSWRIARLVILGKERSSGNTKKEEENFLFQATVSTNRFMSPPKIWCWSVWWGKWQVPVCKLIIVSFGYVVRTITAPRWGEGGMVRTTLHTRHCLDQSLPKYNLLPYTYFQTPLITAFDVTAGQVLNALKVWALSQPCFTAGHLWWVYSLEILGLCYDHLYFYALLFNSILVWPSTPYFSFSSNASFLFFW